MNILLTGSMAFDTIMVFEDKFKNHILAEQAHILNLSFFTPKMRRCFGGCAGNIAYTLKLLGGSPKIMATVGQDFSPYLEWLEKNKIDTQHIKPIDDEFTGQAFVITDIDNNQITAFHPGAMNFAHQNKVTDAENIQLGIVSPDGRDAMLEHAAQFHKAEIPFVFDPGQGLPMFSGEELATFIEQANYLIVNDYESHMLAEKTQLSVEQIGERVEAMIITKGGEGSHLYLDGKQSIIPVAPISKAVDPTGCGDAYRAGVLFALSKGSDWQTAGEVGSVCGAIKIEQAATQQHVFSQNEFAERYQQAYQKPLALFS